MGGVARLTDLWSGICCCHSDPTCIGMSGPIITCSPDVNINSIGAARIGDITIGYCGHTGVIVGSSINSKCNYRGLARIGDMVAGCNIGVIITSSPNVNSG